MPGITNWKGQLCSEATENVDHTLTKDIPR